MSKPTVRPTGIERHFREDEIIVSKTDLRGRITYANRVFLRVAGFSERELLGAPHSVIRHPDMPRCIFWRMWDTIQAGNEIFAYVKNLAKNGDHYWVFAHVTPTFDVSGEIVAFHSNRRVAAPEGVARVEPLYRELCALESGAPDRHSGTKQGHEYLQDLLDQSGVGYDEFVFSL